MKQFIMSMQGTLVGIGLVVVGCVLLLQLYDETAHEEHDASKGEL